MHGYQYRVVVSDGTTATSNPATLTVNVPAFNNTGTWQLVGTAGISAGFSYSTDLALDATGTPFVAYRDEANGNKATVMKYNGSSWGEVGAGATSGGE